MPAGKKYFKIRDLRKKEKFFIDDSYLNGYASRCGWKASLVYISLCRHANKNQSSFPSIELMSKELAVGINTIRRGIKDLINYNIIAIKKDKNEKGQWLNNTYVLLDKSVWVKTVHRPVGALDIHRPVGIKPPPCGDKNHRPVVTTKDTHIKDTHIRNIHEHFEKQKDSKVREYKRLPLEKQTIIHRLCYHLEDELKTKIVTWGKQAKAINQMLKAGYTEEQIKKIITYMAKKDEFFSDKGFDLMTVASQISRYKAEAERRKNV